MSDAYELTFNWPHAEANSVIVTGSFDNWSHSLHLERTPSGFSNSIAVPWDTKIIYKFIVDGNWKAQENQPTEFDGSGNINNVVFSPVKPAIAPSTEAEPNAPGVEEVEETSAAANTEEVAAEVPIVIQPVVDGSLDTTNEAKAVSTAEVSTHVPAAPEADVKEELETPASTEPAPTPAVEAVPVAVPEPESTLPTAEDGPKPVEEASAAVERPSTPTPQEQPGAGDETPKAVTPASPVTPLKTTSTAVPAPGPASPTHARTSTVSTSPPSSIAPSTPQTQSVFTHPTIAEASAELQSSPGRKNVASASSSVREGRKPNISIIGRLKNVFKSKASPEKMKEKARKHSRFGSESPARNPAKAAN